MIYEIKASPVNERFPFAKEFNELSEKHNVPPPLVAAIGYVETLCVLSPRLAEKYIAFDGGRGVCQLTSSYPPNWDTACDNIEYAITAFVAPALEYWHNLEPKIVGDNLVRCVAAEYNSGRGNALVGHGHGNVGEFTTLSSGVQYDTRALYAYRTLAYGSLPALP